MFEDKSKETHNSPKKYVSPKKDDDPKKDDGLKKDVSPKKNDDPKKDDRPKKDDGPKIDDSPKKEDSPQKENGSKIDDENDQKWLDGTWCSPKTKFSFSKIKGDSIFWYNHTNIDFPDTKPMMSGKLSYGEFDEAKPKISEVSGIKAQYIY